MDEKHSGFKRCTRVEHSWVLMMMMSSLPEDGSIGSMSPGDEMIEVVSRCLPHRQVWVSNLSKFATQWLQVDSNPRPSGYKAQNIPLHHRVPQLGIIGVIILTQTPRIYFPNDFSMLLYRRFVDAVTSLQKIVAKLPQTEADPSRLLKYGYALLPFATPDLHIAADMPAKDAETLFYQYIRTPSIICPKKVRIGRVEDGGWDACVAGPLNITTPCLVYSIGIGPDSTFDNTIADTYRCLNMAFDPSIGKADHKPKELLWFFNTGLGRNNTVNEKKWRIRTFGSMLQEYGHDNKTIDILKIDTEYAEWESFEAMFEEGSLRNVKQLMFEFHTKELGIIRQITSSKDYAYYWQILRGLDKLGFKMWHYFPNHLGVYKSNHTATMLPCCGNVYYVNINHIV